ncbi:MAG: FtsX-like permease family protein [Flammeovirgaceae bacterium]|nr:FtsX-like permease family protein [Flammeovirgaceae bacterium]
MKIFGPNNPFVNVRVSGEDTQAALQSIESTWKKFAPQESFNYKFLDQEIKTLYKNESNTGNVFAVFSALAIIIACVGLFGLAAYMTSLRTKEIGIRKVMGANVSSVVVLLSRDFARLIVIALIIAIPAGWYVMDQWLGSFAFRTEIHWWVFVLAGFLALSIALLTVSYQSIRAAIMSPTRSLRSE